MKSSKLVVANLWLIVTFMSLVLGMTQPIAIEVTNGVMWCLVIGSMIGTFFAYHIYNCLVEGGKKSYIWMVIMTILTLVNVGRAIPTFTQLNYVTLGYSYLGGVCVLFLGAAYSCRREYFPSKE